MSTRPPLAVRAVVFDLGGTVLEIRHDVLSDIACRHGAVPRPGWIARGERDARRRIHALMAGGGSNDDGWRALYDGLLLAAGVTEDRLPAAFADTVEHFQAHHLWTREMPGMGAAVRELGRRGYRVAALSNSDGRAAGILAGLGLLDAFEFVIDSHDVGVEKPDPRIFALATGRLALPPGDCAYVGDLEPVDVAGARAAGLVPVLFDPYGCYAGDEPFATAHGDAPRACGPAELLALFPARAGVTA